MPFLLSSLEKPKSYWNRMYKNNKIRTWFDLEYKGINLEMNLDIKILRNSDRNLVEYVLLLLISFFLSKLPFAVIEMVMICLHLEELLCWWRERQTNTVWVHSEHTHAEIYSTVIHYFLPTSHNNCTKIILHSSPFSLF